jgi:hypothetical protein
MKPASIFPLPFNSVRSKSGGKEGRYVIGAMFTPGYAEKAERLAASCEAFGLSYVLHEVPAIHRSLNSRFGTDDLSFTKPNFIHHLLQTYQKPVLYLDADCEFAAEPALMDQLVSSGRDFAIYNWLADDYVDRFVPLELSLVEELIGGRLVRKIRMLRAVRNQVGREVRDERRLQVDEEAELPRGSIGIPLGWIGDTRERKPRVSKLRASVARRVRAADRELLVLEAIQKLDVDAKVHARAFDRDREVGEREARVGTAVRGDDESHLAAQQLVDPEVLEVAAVTELDEVPVLASSESEQL